MITYLGIIIGGTAGFLYWKFIGCASGACPITSNKYISVAYGALLGSLLITSIAGAVTKQGFLNKFNGDDSAIAFKNISADEMISMTTDSEYIIIDIRTPAELESGYIPGTDKFIDFNGGNFEEQIQELDVTKSYIIYCRSGYRSSKACEVMSKSGFTNLYNLSGGIKNWNGELKKD